MALFSPLTCSSPSLCFSNRSGAAMESSFMKRIIRPLERPMPALRAAAGPLFSCVRTVREKAYECDRPLTAATVSSVDPSSQTITSKVSGAIVCWERRSRHSKRMRLRLYVGMITLNSRLMKHTSNWILDAGYSLLVVFLAPYALPHHSISTKANSSVSERRESCAIVPT